MALTGRAFLLAVAGVPVVGILLPSWLGILVWLLVLVVAVSVDVLLAGAVRRLEFSRSGDTSVRLGESATVRLTMVNPGPRPVRGVLRDAWPPSAGVGVDRHPVSVAPGGRFSVRTDLRPDRRGDRHAHLVTVRAAGPLGLAARQCSHQVPWTVRALPRFDSRRHLPSRLARLRELDGRQAVRTRGAGTEFDSLREYVVGDDVRSIDWRATARAADVMVRTWRPERDRHILLVLDTSRTAAARVGSAPRLDALLDTALLLAALAARAGDHVGLLAYDRRVRASVTGSLSSMISTLAGIDPTLVELDARSLTAEVLRRTRHRSLIVLLTALDPAPVEHGLLPLIPHLTTRHRLLIAGVTDPHTLTMASSRGSATATYSAAAAARALAERHHVTTLLTRAGVDVVDASPEDLPPAVADRYLSLKAAGRL